MPELDITIQRQIDQLCARGDELADADRFVEAVAQYDQAWALLPVPREQWEAATWILTAIGDAHFLRGDFASARHALGAAMYCPNAIGNPFIHLRLGQAQFELGNLDRAADELMRAYMGAGPEIFEDEDGKYLQFLSTRARGIQFPR